MSIDKRGTKFRARLYVQGRQVSRSFDTKAAARRWEAEQLAQRERGEWVDQNNPVTVEQWAMQWAEGRPYRPTTADRVRSHIDNHIKGTKLGKKRLVTLRPSDVQNWATERSKELAPSTLRNLVSLLRSMLTDALLDRVISSNPAVKVRLPHVTREQITALTVDQVYALADAMPKRCRAMILVQAGLGLRIGELRALRSFDVDFLRREVRVTWQIVPKSLTRTVPKTPKSRRTIPLPSMVADALAAHMAEYPPLEDGTLFSTTHGNVWESRYYMRRFGQAVKTAGLPEGTTTHDLRHFYAATLLAAGESPQQVAAWMGHDSMAMVIQTYSHLIARRDEHGRRAIDAVMKRTG